MIGAPDTDQARQGRDGHVESTGWPLSRVPSLPTGTSADLAGRPQQDLSTKKLWPGYFSDSFQATLLATLKLE